MATKTTTFKSLARKVRLTFDYGAQLDWDKQDEWHRNANGYHCTLHYQGRRYTFNFWQGTGIAHDPTAEACLDCLLSDAQSGDMSFSAFCRELGYDEDSRKAEQTWKACQKSAANMRRLLGDDFKTFLYADRNADNN